MERRALGPLSVTRFGFGTAGIAGMYQACPPEQAQATLEAAWAAGIRYFDTAPFYGAGLAEARLGTFLEGKPRDEVVISTKAGRLIESVAAEDASPSGFVGAPAARVWFDYSHDGILRSVEASLARLGTDRIDILYVHDIGDYAHGPVEGARHLADLTGSGLQALRSLQAQGVIGAWGLGVNETAICLRLMAETPPEVILLAGRYSLLDRRAEAEFLPAIRAQGLPLVLGGVLNSGILATGAVAGARFDYAPASAEILGRVAAIEAEATTLGSSLLAAALNFPLAEPSVASVLIGAADPPSLGQNLAAAARPPPPSLYARTAAFALR